MHQRAAADGLTGDLLDIVKAHQAYQLWLRKSENTGDGFPAANAALISLERAVNMVTKMMVFDDPNPNPEVWRYRRDLRLEPRI